MSKELLELKIKRNTYTITTEDVFMDNGACVQLLSQSKEHSGYGQYYNPKLSIRAIKEIGSFLRIQQKHTYGITVQVFTLDNL